MEKYKVAIPNNNGEVNQHYGQSSSFAIVSINGDEVINIENVSTVDLAHQHEGLADFLRKQGVESVIVGGIGPGAAEALTYAGLQLFTGASGKIEDVANMVAKGEFVSRPGTCNHGKCGGHSHH